MPLSEDDFGYVRALLREHAAIELGSAKKYAVESRLAQVADAAGLASPRELVEQLRTGEFGPGHRALVEALLDTQTWFFRDWNPFELLRTFVVPELLEQRAIERKLHVWCGACATGQEAYSVAMLLRQHFPELSEWTVGFVASDLSTSAIERARAGRYTLTEVRRGLPGAYLDAFFREHDDGFRVDPALRAGIDFQVWNLIDDGPPTPAFDVVFLRNVLGYFDAARQDEVLERVRGRMRSDGYLFLGADELGDRLGDPFETVQMGAARCFRLREG